MESTACRFVAMELAMAVELKAVALMVGTIAAVVATAFASVVNEADAALAAFSTFHSSFFALVAFAWQCLMESVECHCSYRCASISPAQSCIDLQPICVRHCHLPRTFSCE